MEHLNKQYLAANYLAAWKPLANKLATLTWESVLIFLAAFAHKGSRTTPPPPPLPLHHSGLLLTDELNRLDLIRELKKEISGVSLHPSSLSSSGILGIFCVCYCQKLLGHKRGMFLTADSRISVLVWAVLFWLTFGLPDRTMKSYHEVSWQGGYPAYWLGKGPTFLN